MTSGRKSTFGRFYNFKSRSLNMKNWDTSPSNTPIIDTVTEETTDTNTDTENLSEIDKNNILNLQDSPEASEVVVSFQQQSTLPDDDQLTTNQIHNHVTDQEPTQQSIGLRNTNIRENAILDRAQETETRTVISNSDKSTSPISISTPEIGSHTISLDEFDIVSIPSLSENISSSSSISAKSDDTVDNRTNGTNRANISSGTNSPAIHENFNVVDDSSELPSSNHFDIQPISSSHVSVMSVISTSLSSTTNTQQINDDFRDTQSFFNINSHVSNSTSQQSPLISSNAVINPHLNTDLQILNATSLQSQNASSNHSSPSSHSRNFEDVHHEFERGHKFDSNNYNQQQIQQQCNQLNKKPLGVRGNSGISLTRYNSDTSSTSIQSPILGNVSRNTSSSNIKAIMNNNGIYESGDIQGTSRAEITGEELRNLYDNAQESNETKEFYKPQDELENIILIPTKADIEPEIGIETRKNIQNGTPKLSPRKVDRATIPGVLRGNNDSIELLESIRAFEDFNNIQDITDITGTTDITDTPDIADIIDITDIPSNIVSYNKIEVSKPIQPTTNVTEEDGDRYRDRDISTNTHTHRRAIATIDTLEIRSEGMGSKSDDNHNNITKNDDNNTIKYDEYEKYDDNTTVLCPSTNEETQNRCNNQNKKICTPVLTETESKAIPETQIQIQIQIQKSLESLPIPTICESSLPHHQLKPQQVSPTKSSSFSPSLSSSSLAMFPDNSFASSQQQNLNPDPNPSPTSSIPSRKSIEVAHPPQHYQYQNQHYQQHQQHQQPYQQQHQYHQQPQPQYQHYQHQHYPSNQPIALPSIFHQSQQQHQQHQQHQTQLFSIPAAVHPSLPPAHSISSHSPPIAYQPQPLGYPTYPHQGHQNHQTPQQQNSLRASDITSPYYTNPNTKQSLTQAQLQPQPQSQPQVQSSTLPIATSVTDEGDDVDDVDKRTEYIYQYEHVNASSFLQDPDQDVDVVKTNADTQTQTQADADNVVKQDGIEQFQLPSATIESQDFMDEDLKYLYSMNDSFMREKSNAPTAPSSPMIGKTLDKLQEISQENRKETEKQKESVEEDVSERSSNGMSVSEASEIISKLPTLNFADNSMPKTSTTSTTSIAATSTTAATPTVTTPTTASMKIPIASLAALHSIKVPKSKSSKSKSKSSKSTTSTSPLDLSKISQLGTSIYESLESIFEYLKQHILPTLTSIFGQDTIQRVLLLEKKYLRRLGITGLCGFVLFALITGRGLHFITSIVGFVIPFYRTYLALKNYRQIEDMIRVQQESTSMKSMDDILSHIHSQSSKSPSQTQTETTTPTTLLELQQERVNREGDIRHWLQYWSVFSAFSAAEASIGWILRFIPFYDHLKLFILLASFTRKLSVPGMIWNRCINPLFQKHESTLTYIANETWKDVKSVIRGMIRGALGLPANTTSTPTSTSSSTISSTSTSTLNSPRELGSTTDGATIQSSSQDGILLMENLLNSIQNETDGSNGRSSVSSASSSSASGASSIASTIRGAARRISLVLPSTLLNNVQRVLEDVLDASSDEISQESENDAIQVSRNNRSNTGTNTTNTSTQGDNVIPAEQGETQENVNTKMSSTTSPKPKSDILSKEYD